MEINECEVEEKVEKEYRRRKVPRILRSCRFNKEKEREKHFRELIMLYTSWRVEARDLTSVTELFEEQYNLQKKTIDLVRGEYEKFAKEVNDAEDNEQREDDLENAWSTVAVNDQHLEEIDESKNPDKGTGEEYDIGEELGLHKITVIGEKHNKEGMTGEDLRIKMRLLNIGQYEFIMNLIHHVKTRDDPFNWTFLSGGAGVGKTFTSTIFYECLFRVLSDKAGYEPETMSILKIAPTGKAAYLIRGNTIHSALRIPINNNYGYKSLDSDSRNTLRTQLRGLKYIIVDEVSMLGGGLFNFVNKRFQEIMGSSKDLGGIQPLFCGDFFQLPPVCDCWIFQNPRIGYQLLVENLWQKHVVMYELKEIMRQGEDRNFAEILNRIREGNQTKEDIKTISQRKNEINKEFDQEDAYIYFDNKNVDAHNKLCYDRAKSEKKYIQAIDNTVQPMEEKAAK